jgi:hypothetical protein
VAGAGAAGGAGGAVEWVGFTVVVTTGATLVPGAVLADEESVVSAVVEATVTAAVLTRVGLAEWAVAHPASRPTIRAAAARRMRINRTAPRPR